MTPCAKNSQLNSPRRGVDIRNIEAAGNFIAERISGTGGGLRSRVFDSGRRRAAFRHLRRSKFAGKNIAETGGPTAASADAIGPLVNRGRAGRDFIVTVNQTSASPATEKTQLSPHLAGPEIRRARERLGLSSSDYSSLEARGAFDAKWLAAAEDGARVDRRRLHQARGPARSRASRHHPACRRPSALSRSSRIRTRRRRAVRRP